MFYCDDTLVMVSCCVRVFFPHRFWIKYHILLLLKQIHENDQHWITLESIHFSTSNKTCASHIVQFSAQFFWADSGKKNKNKTAYVSYVAYTSNVMMSLGTSQALTGQGGVEFVAKEALPLLSSLIELPTSFRYNPVPQPGQTTQIYCHTSESDRTTLYSKQRSFHFLHQAYERVSSQKIYTGWVKTARPYLSPILIASSGEQEIVSGQLGDLCCLLSRNHPESTRPRTCASAPSCCSWLATLSIFSKTPVPPALQGSQDKQ